jgi:hypothetical protein
MIDVEEFMAFTSWMDEVAGSFPSHLLIRSISVIRGSIEMRFLG